MKKTTRKSRKEKRSTYQTPAQWLADILTGGASTSGATVNEVTALNAATVFACVRNLAEDIGKLPLFLYRNTSGGGKERETGSPLYYMMHDSPNDEMTSFEFRQAIMIDVLLGGNGYAEIVRNGAGMPVELRKIARDRVKVERNALKQLIYKVRNDNMEDVTIAAADMLHVRGMGDGLMGWSIIKLARESVGLALSAEQSGAAFFGNNSVPAGVLETKEKLSIEAMKKLAESWKALYGGPDNRHKVAVLENSMTFKPMSIPQDDAQYLETREFSVEEICRWYRMPPHKVGHLKRATGWTTLETTNTDYVVDTLMPWMERWEQELQRKLLSPSQGDLFFEFLVEGLLRGDSAARSAFYREQFNIGAMSQNDIRRAENRNPIGPEGDVYYVPLNMVPSEIAAKGPQQPDPAPSPPPTDPAQADNVAAKRQSKLNAIENAHTAMLEEAFARVLKVEKERVERSMKKPDYAAWVADFYKDHHAHVRAAIGGVLESYMASSWAVLSDLPPKDGLFEAVRKEIDAIGVRHAKTSLAEVGDAVKVENWMSRADAEAKAEMAAVSKMILEFAGKGA